MVWNWGRFVMNWLIKIWCDGFYLGWVVSLILVGVIVGFFIGGVFVDNLGCKCIF